MPKTFYTEHDIEDMVKRGTMTLTLNDDIVLTDLAYERAKRLGLKLLRENEKLPSAPMRPYVSEVAKVKPAASPSPSPTSESDLRQRVRDAVIARLGNEVDPKLLDTIIQRVLNNVGVK
jgi:hypothetical protein